MWENRLSRDMSIHRRWEFFRLQAWGEFHASHPEPRHGIYGWDFWGELIAQGGESGDLGGGGSSLSAADIKITPAAFDHGASGAGGRGGRQGRAAGLTPGRPPAPGPLDESRPSSPPGGAQVLIRPLPWSATSSAPLAAELGYVNRPLSLPGALRL